MNVIYEIQKHFANLPNDTFKKVDQTNGYFFWIYKKGNAYGTAVELDFSTEIAESFATAKIFEMKQQLADGEEYIFLCLENSEINLRNEFAAVCSQFIFTGDNGEYRAELINNPQKWWEQWRDLLGNSIRKKNVYSLLGELLIYSKLLERGIIAY
jgi:hypothetical protein